MSQIDLPRRHHLDAITSERWTASDQNRWTPSVRYAWTASLESAAGVWKIARKAGIELTAGIAARGCNNRVPPEKRAEIVAALNVNPNATAVAREVGGVSGVGVWKIAQVEGIELRHSCIDQARHRRGGPSVVTPSG